MARLVIDPVTRIEGHLRVEVQVGDGQVTEAYSSSTMWRGIETIVQGRDPRDAWPLTQSISSYPRSAAGLFASVQTRLKTFLASGNIGPFTNGYWGHPAYRLDPELNLLALSHYLDALDFQRDYIRVHAMLGGKNPHPQTYLVGGMASPIDLNSQDAINDDTFQELALLLQKGLDFVQQVYLPDLYAIAASYPEWTRYGSGLTSYMVFGDYSPSPPRTGQPPADGLFPGGVIRAGSLQVEPFDPAGVAESVARSWFRYDGADGGATALPPWQGETIPDYTGPEPPFSHLDVAGKYSWLKAPRYQGMAVEVGPLARLLVGYASGDVRIRPLVTGALGQLKLPPSALMSTLGRVLARGLETELMARYSLDLLNSLRSNVAGGDLAIADTTKWAPSSWPAGQARGVGFHEAPRGSLSHWVVIENQHIRNYQAVVPSTWNASPRDEKGNPGAYEAALVGTPVADPRRPLEILRTLHSFDPCMAAPRMYTTPTAVTSSRCESNDDPRAAPRPGVSKARGGGAPGGRASAGLGPSGARDPLVAGPGDCRAQRDRLPHW
jgi:Ni,Fe-hydrogenase I large subunit